MALPIVAGLKHTDGLPDHLVDLIYHINIACIDIAVNKSPNKQTQPTFGLFFSQDFNPVSISEGHSLS